MPKTLRAISVTGSRCMPSLTERLKRPAIALRTSFLPGKLPELASLDDADGNHIVLSLPDGTYALYAHLKPGSLMVKAGDTVTKGQKLAEVGNTGNTSAPHLHFHVMDGPSPLTSSGLPYVLERLDVVGIVPSTEDFDRAEVGGKPLPIDTVNPSGPMTDVMPMDLSVVTLPRNLP